MVQLLDCAECGTLLKSSPRVAPGKKVKCLSCKMILLVGVNNRLLLEPSVLTQPDLVAQDDDEGGGDWGGSKKDDTEDDDEEEDEEDEDGKKKKKKKKKGFIAGLLSGFLTYVIGGVVLSLLCCCVVIGSMLGLFPSTPAFLGTWEKVSGAGDNERLEKKLVINSDKTGSYTVYTYVELEEKDDKGEKKVDKTETSAAFKWTVPEEKDKKTITLEMNDPKSEFWNGKAKDEFTWATLGSGNGSTLTLTPAAGDAITFVREFVEPVKTAPTKKRRR